MVHRKTYVIGYTLNLATYVENNQVYLMYEVESPDYGIFCAELSKSWYNSQKTEFQSNSVKKIISIIRVFKGKNAIVKL